MDNKKLSFLWITAAALLTACSTSDQESLAVGGNDHSPVITLTTNSAESTMRASTTDVQQNEGNFLDGEKVAIFFKDAHTVSEDKSTYTQPLIYTSDGDGNLSHGTPQYWPKLLHPLSVWGVYPSGLCDANALVGSTAYTFSVAKNQSAYSKANPEAKMTKDEFWADRQAQDPSYDATNLDTDYAAYEADYDAQVDAAKGYKGSDLMIGIPMTTTEPVTTANPLTQTVSSGPVHLTFTHMLSKIIVKIVKTDATEYTDADLSVAKVTILGTKPTTTFKVGVWNGSNFSSVLTAASGDVTPIVAREVGSETYYDDSTDPDHEHPLTHTLYTGKDVAAVIVPQALAASTQFIKIEVGEDTFIYTLDTAKTFEAAHVYTYTVKIHKAAITVTSTISPWTDLAGDRVNGNGYLQTP